MSGAWLACVVTSCIPISTPSICKRGKHLAGYGVSEYGSICKGECFSGNIGIACMSFLCPAHRGAVSISSSGRSPQAEHHWLRHVLAVSYRLNGVHCYPFFFLKLSIWACAQPSKSTFCPGLQPCSFTVCCLNFSHHYCSQMRVYIFVFLFCFLFVFNFVKTLNEFPVRVSINNLL